MGKNYIFYFEPGVDIPLDLKKQGVKEKIVLCNKTLKKELEKNPKLPVRDICRSIYYYENNKQIFRDANLTFIVENLVKIDFSIKWMSDFNIFQSMLRKLNLKFKRFLVRLNQV